jgi:hypothetical protein
MDIDAVHQRAGDAFLIALHPAHGTGALFAIIAIKSARAGILTM